MPRLVMSPGGGMSKMPSPWESISPHLQQLSQTLGRRKQEKQRQKTTYARVNDATADVC